MRLSVRSSFCAALHTPWCCEQVEVSNRRNKPAGPVRAYADADRTEAIALAVGGATIIIGS